MGYGIKVQRFFNKNEMQNRRFIGKDAKGEKRKVGVYEDFYETNENQSLEKYSAYKAIKVEEMSFHAPNNGVEQIAFGKLKKRIIAYAVLSVIGNIGTVILQIAAIKRGVFITVAFLPFIIILTLAVALISIKWLFSKPEIAIVEVVAKFCDDEIKLIKDRNGRIEGATGVRKFYCMAKIEEPEKTIINNVPVGNLTHKKIYPKAKMAIIKSPRGYKGYLI